MRCLYYATGCPDMEELRGSDASGVLRESKSNAGEADIVMKHVLALRALGVPAADIAVITPYNAQVSLMPSLLLHRTFLGHGSVILVFHRRLFCVLRVNLNNNSGSSHFCALGGRSSWN